MIWNDVRALLRRRTTGVGDCSPRRRGAGPRDLFLVRRRMAAGASQVASGGVASRKQWRESNRTVPARWQLGIEIEFEKDGWAHDVVPSFITVRFENDYRYRYSYTGTRCAVPSPTGIH